MPGEGWLSTGTGRIAPPALPAGACGSSRVEPQRSRSRVRLGSAAGVSGCSRSRLLAARPVRLSPQRLFPPLRSRISQTLGQVAEAGLGTAVLYELIEVRGGAGAWREALG